VTIVSTPGRRAVAVALAALVAAAAAWFLLVGPKRAEAAKLDGQIHDVNASIVAAHAASRTAKEEDTELTPLFLLARAMPETVDMAGVIVELNRLSRRSGLSFTSITPRPETPGNGYAVVPVEVAFDGRFENVHAFLRRLREQIRLGGAGLHVDGRLFTVQSIELAEGEDKLPQLKVTSLLNVFLYRGGASAPAGGVPAPAPAEGEQVAQGSS
jgi:Tfp pilus assembly protein PilO